MTSRLTSNSRLSRAARAVGAVASVIIGAWTSAYFAVSSSLGPPLLGLANPSLPGWSAERVTWSSALDWVAVIQPRLRNFEGHATVTATAAIVTFQDLRPYDVQLLRPEVMGSGGELGIGASRLVARIDGTMQALGGMRLSSLEAQDFRLDLRWDEQGKFNLAKSFLSKPPRPPQPPPERPGPPVDLPLLQIDGIVLGDAAVSFTWPGGRFSADHITATGTYATSPWAGVFIDAGLEGANPRLELPDVVSPTQHWQGIAIRGYRMEGLATSVDEVALETDDRSFIRASEVHVAPGHVRSRVAVGVADLQTGSTSVRGVAAKGRVDLVKQALGAAGTIAIENVALEGLDGPHDLHLRGGEVSSVEVTLDGTAAKLRAERAHIGYLNAQWTPEPIRDATLSATADVSVGGGTYRATLATKQHGGLTTRGKIDVSLWRQRVTTEAAVTMRNLTGPLARLMGVTPPGEGSRTYRASAPFSELRRGTWRPHFEPIEPPAEKVRALEVHRP